MTTATEAITGKIITFAGEVSLSHATVDVLKIVEITFKRELKAKYVQVCVRGLDGKNKDWCINRIEDYDLDVDSVKKIIGKFENSASIGVLEKEGFVTFPLSAQGEFLGILIVGHDKTFHNWTKDEQFLAKSFLKIASFAIKSCQGVEKIVIKGIKKAVAQETERLELTNQKLEKASQNQSDFLSHMSHELRTPLNAIIGIANLLSENLANSEYSQQISVLQRAGEGLLELINDVLDVSKIAAGEIKLVEQEFRLDELLENVVQQTFPKVSDSVKLDLDYSSLETLNFVGDAFRLRQVLLNVLGNAAKYTKKGSIKLLVKSGSNEGRYIFSVTDTGPGVLDERKKAIFDRFGQADHDSAIKYGGAGLGLSICQSLVSMMSGSIWVEDNIHAPSGSIFIFDIQFGTSVDHKIDTTKILKQKVSKDFLTRPIRILVVEDSPANIFLLRAYFKATSFLVDHAADGQLGVMQFKKNPYDLVLMDVQMPVLDGYGATMQIRMYEKIKERKRTPILALTANALDADLKKIMQSGFDSRLTKPIKRNDLFLAIQHAVDGVSKDDQEK